MRKFDVFLSYNSKDSPFVVQLDEALRGRGLRVFFDRRDVRPGNLWQDELSDGIENSRCVVVAFGEADLGPWQRLEMQLAQDRAVREQGDVIPVLAPGSPDAGQLPPFLRLRNAVDMRQGLKTKEADRLFTALEESGIEDSPATNKEPVSTLPPFTLSKLPATDLSHFVGREEELAWLDAAWGDPDVRVASLVAFGGVGKTAIITRWLEQMQADNFRGAETVLGWSFYSQGTDSTNASGDPFVEYALRWFGYEGEPITSAWEKGAELGRLIRQKRALVVLDGLEPLQHPADVHNGNLKDLAVAAMLRELSFGNTGLCVITTRVDVGDLKGRTGSSSRELETLPVEAGADLLRHLRIEGTQAEIEEASEGLGGHALALTLLGTYLRDVLGSDIRKWKEVPLLGSGTDGSEHAEHVLEAYAKLFSEGPERSTLHLLGLFDRPAEPQALGALRAEPEVPNLTDGIGAGQERSFREALARLRKARLLISTPNSCGEDSLDAHPIVRQYIGELLQRKHPQAFREGQRRLYTFYRDSTEEFPDTVESIQPLYRAVVHGALAGKEQEALEEVFWRRIRRGNQQYSPRQLGTFSSELTALSAFFDEQLRMPTKKVTENNRSLLLNEVGFCLRGLGRLAEAVRRMEAGLGMDIAQQDWMNAAAQAINLSEVYLLLGKIDRCLKIRDTLLSLAQRCKNNHIRVVCLTTQANTLHQAGRFKESLSIFRDAENLEDDELISLRGYQYCDLLLTDPITVSAWEKSGFRKRRGWINTCKKVQQRAIRSLELSSRLGALFAVALDTLTLARSTLGLALATNQAQTAQLYLEAGSSFKRAIENLRRAGAQEFISLGLLARATFYRVTEQFDLAIADLNETLDLATRSQMRLFEADAHLEWARLHRNRGNLPAARESLEKARAIVEATGYGRRTREVRWLAEQLGSG